MVALRSSGPVLYPAGSDHVIAPALVARETGPSAAPKPRLLDRVRQAVRARHYSRRTEKAYVHWIKRYIFFHGKRHPAEMCAAEVSAFLTSLAVDDKVAASTVQELLGHHDVSTTMIYTHVLNRGPAGVRSPADRMFLS